MCAWHLTFQCTVTVSAANRPSRSLTERVACCSIVAIRSRISPSTPITSRPSRTRCDTTTTERWWRQVSYLLLNGDLPDQMQYAQFQKTIKNHTMVHEKLKTFISGFKDNAHPMAIMVGVVGALSAFYHDSLDITIPEQRSLAAIRLIAKARPPAQTCFQRVPLSLGGGRCPRSRRWLTRQPRVTRLYIRRTTTAMPRTSSTCSSLPRARKSLPRPGMASTHPGRVVYIHLNVVK